MAKTESLQLTKRATALLLVIAMLFISVISVAAYSRTAVINDNGEETGLSTSSVYTDKILNTADIKLSPHDEIIRTDENGVINIKILRAFDVTIINCGEEVIVPIAKGTVEDAINKANITIKEDQVVSPELFTELKEGMVITIDNTVLMDITVDGETNSYKVPKGTVSQALKFAGVEVGEDDIITADKDSEVTEGMSVAVKRVEYKEETKTVTLDYKTEEKKTNTLYVGESKVETKGVEGEEEQVVKKKYVNGEYKDEEVISKNVVKKPVNKVVLVGNKSKTQTTPPATSTNKSNSNGSFTDQSGNTVYYKSKIVGTATAYSSADGAITATGVPVYVGGVAVNPNVIPYGSKLYIQSNDGQYIYGYATAVDTGGALMSGDALVDLFYWSRSECRQFGRRSVTVYVI